MKQAWIFSDNADLLARVKANYLIELNILGLIANKAAYAEGEDWLNQLVEYIDGNQDVRREFIAAKIPLDQVRQAAGHVPRLDRCDRGRRAHQARSRLEEAQPDKTPRRRTSRPEQMVERFFVREAKVQLNQGASYGARRRQSHAHEPGDVAARWSSGR